MDIRFKRKADIKHGIYNIVLQGSINDAADFGSIPPGDLAQIFVDFESVKYINSLGIKSWIKWHTQLREKHKRAALYLTNCQESIVNQMNMVRGFLPAWATVKSFYVPFICKVCGANEPIVYRLNHEFVYKEFAKKMKLIHPIANCKICKVQMELDVDPDNYFRFLEKK